MSRHLPIGTRSLLYGAHQFVLHPLFLAVAWWRLYGAPWDPRLWVAFVIHDWGYWGLDNMDGPTGQLHPAWAGRVMARMFGPGWGDFTACHSRYFARLHGRPPSRLCAADKLATALVPAWLYLPMVRLSGELPEYMALAARADFYTGRDPAEWFRLLAADWRRIAYAQAARGRE